MSRKTSYEQETIILWNNEDDWCTIDTCDARMLQRLKELSQQHPTAFETVKSGYRWATYRCSKRLVSIRAPYSEKRRQHDREVALAQHRMPPSRSMNLHPEREE